MSNGENKPGMRDISDLKARLGMLNKSAAGPKPAANNPFAPKASAPNPQVSLDSNSDAFEATAVVNLNALGAPPPPRAPSLAPMQSTRPAPVSVPSAPAAPVRSVPPSPFAAPAAPSAPPGGAFGLGASEDLFKKKAAPAPSTPSAAPAAAPANEAARKAAEMAAQFAAPAAPEPPPVEAGFAHPLQRGRYASASAPVDLNAQEEEALATFEGRQAGIRPMLAIGMTLAVAGLTLVFGFFIGDVRASRRMVNAQIDSSILMRDRLLPLLDQATAIFPVVAAMARDSGTVDWNKLKAIPKELPTIKAGSIIHTPMPLEKELATRAATATADINELFIQLREHRMITLRRDKAELEQLAKGSAWASNKYFGVAFEVPPLPDPTKKKRGAAPPPARTGPVKGRVVALVGKAQQAAEGPGFVIPVRQRDAEKERFADVRGLVIIPKTDLMSGGQGNALTQYTKRVDRMKVLVKKIMQYEQPLREQLQTEAARQKVFSF